LPRPLADEVAKLVTHDRRDRYQHEQQPQRCERGGASGKQSRGEQQRVTRQEEPHQQAGLGEHRGEHAQQSEAAQQVCGVEDARS